MPGSNAGMAPCACSTCLSLSAECSQRTMGRPRGWPGAALAYLLLLLGLPVLCSTGEAVVGSGMWPWQQDPTAALMCHGLSGRAGGAGPHH